MNIPCPVNIPCPGTDSPFANLSSEQPDIPVFHSRCIGSCGFGPDQVYTADNCDLLCVSFVSQEDADLCAARITCPPGIDPTPNCPPDCPAGCPPTCPPGPPKVQPVLFFNTVQTPHVNCANGTFTWIVAAGLFSGKTEAEANAKAFSWGLDKAADNVMCLDYIQTEACNEVTYENFINAGGTVIEPLSWSLQSGTLPDGISLFDSGSEDTTFVVLSGNPTTPGTYNFTLRATDANGNYAEKAYTIKVADIANTSPLTGGTIGTPYSETLTAAGPVTSPLSWQVIAGALPDGLTLDEATGVISGTPTVVGTFNFTIKLQDQAT